MGGSSGGGGNSGKIEYPAYISEVHRQLMDKVDAGIQTASGLNPYIGATTCDPLPASEEMIGAVDMFADALKATPSFNARWDIAKGLVMDLYNTVSEQNPFAAIIARQKQKAETDFYNDILPKFRAGLRDQGVVMTSGYKIGEALMFSKLMEDVALLGPELENKYLLALWSEAPKMVQTVSQQQSQEMFQYIEYAKTILHYQLEVIRMNYTMFKEFTDTNQEYKVLSKTWPLEMQKYMMDSIACVAGAGGASTTAGRSVSKAQSAVGGALSGAAAGAMIGAQTGSIGGPWGAAIGGAVGLIGGLIS